MTKYACSVLGTLLLAGPLAAQTVPDRSDAPATAPAPLADPWLVANRHVVSTPSAVDFNGVIDRYCSRCHGERRQRGNLTLAGFDTATPEANAPIAEKMIKKLLAGMMPPPGARRPGGDTLTLMGASLEHRLDSLWSTDPNPGTRVFQRLNRVEYAESIRDLLGIEVDIGAFLPLDTKSANFDNIADVQMPSATLMEGYLRAAGYVSRMAVGDPRADASSTIYKVPRTASQRERVDGAPIGTRGGTSVVHNFPADGKYVFDLTLYPSPEGELFGRTSVHEQVEVSIDGERVAVFPIDRWMSESDPNGMTMETDSIDVGSGAHRVTAAFVRLFEGPEDDLITPIDHTLADTQIGLSYGVTTMPHLQRLSVVGPFEVTGVSDTPTRRLIFSCRPTSLDEERPCAREILTRLATRAYRRPLDERDVDGLLTFFDQGAEADGFEAGIRTALQAMLASPHFIFRIEETPDEVGTGGVYRIADMALASRLSYFLWGTPPDQELIDRAASGALSDSAVLNAEAQRMLADPRSHALSRRFAAQWLRLQDLDKVHPDALSYPYFDETLAEAMHRETELLFEYLVDQDRSVLELLTADYTFVNERLARHYNIPGVTGDTFRKVSYPDGHRRGLLGHGSVLTLTSHADRTSPVLRGKWVMEVLMGTPPPPPPPDVPDLEATKGTDEGRVLTVRERMEQHRANPTCMACHRFIDPIGLALENFDVTGAWRIRDAGLHVDPVGQLYDGTELNGPDDLRAALLERKELVLRNFTENLMAYALGRRVEYFDMPAVRAITRRAATQNYRMSAFILGIVNTPAFVSNRLEPTTMTGAEGQ